MMFYCQYQRPPTTHPWHHAVRLPYYTVHSGSWQLPEWVWSGIALIVNMISNLKAASTQVDVPRVKS